MTELVFLAADVNAVDQNGRTALLRLCCVRCCRAAAEATELKASRACEDIDSARPLQKKVKEKRDRAGGVYNENLYV